MGIVLKCFMMVCECGVNKSAYTIYKHMYLHNTTTVPCTYIRQLGTLHTLTRLDLEMTFVATQRGHLQLIEIRELMQIGVRLIAIVLAVLAATLRAHRLYALLVIITYVYMLGTWIAAQLEPLLGNGLLYTFAVTGVASLVAAPFHVVY